MYVCGELPSRESTQHVTDPLVAFTLFHQKGGGMTTQRVTLIGDEESVQRGQINQPGAAAVVSTVNLVELEGASQGKTIA